MKRGAARAKYVRRNGAGAETAGARELLLDRILDAAAEAFARQGYERTSMRQVGRQVGLSQSHLYYYVKSKPLLLFETQRRAVTMLVEVLREIEAAPGSAVDKLRNITRAIVRLIAHRSAAVAVYLHERKALPPNLLKALHEEGAQANAILDLIVHQGQQRGELRAIDPIILRQTIISIAAFPYQWLRTGPDARLSYQEIGEILADLVLEGAAVPAPRAARVRARSN